MNAIELHGVTKNFHNVCAIHDVDVTIKENEIVGILGRNGAGKSTLLKIIAHKLESDQGSILAYDKTIEDASIIEDIVYCSQEICYPNGTLKQIMKMYAQFYASFDMARAKKRCSQFHLATNRKFSSLSAGMKSTFVFLCTMACNCKITILDEPVNAIDAVVREQIYTMILEEYDVLPRTILIASHIFPQLDKLISSVLILNDGEILLQGDAEQILGQYYVLIGSEEALEKFTSQRSVIHKHIGQIQSEYLVHGYYDEGIQKELQACHLQYRSVTIEELYISLTKEDAYVNET